MNESEKEIILDRALEKIVTERVEMELINKDYLGYWRILGNQVLNISLGGFKTGVADFFKSIDTSDNPAELIGVHNRFMIRCINSEYIMLAAENIYQSLVENIRSEYVSMEYDIIVNGQVLTLTKMEKILLLLHIYEDRIAIAVAVHKQNMTPAKPDKGGRK